MSEVYGFAIQIDSKGAITSLKAIDQQLKVFDSSAKNAKKTGSGFSEMFASFTAAGLATQALMGLKEGLMQVFKVGAEMEQTRIAFDVMLGSAEKGGEMFNQLKNFADVTPFDNATAYKAGQLLLNYGIEAKNIIPYLQMLGDASGGSTDKFNLLSLAFGQVAAKGRLMGQEALQMTESGFAPLQEISKMTGKSVAVLTKEMEKGQISFDMVVKAFQSATGEGGRFNGMMLKQSQTINGLISTIEGNLQTAFYGLFQSSSPLLGKLAKEVGDLAVAFGDMVTPLESEKLKGAQAEMNAIFEVLKAGNIPIDQRNKLYTELNSKYGQYLSHQISEKDNNIDLSITQEAANQKILEKIKLVANEELITKMIRESTKQDEKLLEKRLLLEKAKAGTLSLTEKAEALNLNATAMAGGIFGTIYNAYEAGSTIVGGSYSNTEGLMQALIQGDINRMNSDKEKREKDLQDKIKLLGMGDYSIAGNLNLSKNQLSQDLADKMKSQKEQFAQNITQSKGTNSINNISENAANLSGKAASGGFGEARTINITIDTFTKIETSKVETKDLERTTENGIADFIDALNNYTYRNGTL